jgi:hypothetical protein
MSEKAASAVREEIKKLMRERAENTFFNVRLTLADLATMIGTCEALLHSDEAQDPENAEMVTEVTALKNKLEAICNSADA